MQAGREVKYRAWDKEQNKMLGPNFDREQYAIVSYNGLALLDITREDEDGYDYEMDVEWLQYTGLHDKNGKEIYEGDILLWDGGFKVYVRVHFKDGMFLAGDMPLYDCVDEEVVGNIYENPELLEVGK
ncbi:YopX family protein [Brevibacillus porteri]|uniref:YopX family protein n=1 Tax=Brevibacillus porteri TaxID=2126350 RepID=UPI003D1EB89C